MKRGIISAFLLIFSTLLFAQKSSNYKPTWISKSLPIPQNNSYIFISETCSGLTIEQAREACLNQLANDRMLLSSVSVSRKSDNTTTILQKNENGKFSETINKQYNIHVLIDGQKSILQAKAIDEYWETIHNNGQAIRMSVLYQCAVQNNPTFDYPIVTSQYGIEDNWRSIIPGWAQMHKGAYLKGGLIMGGSVVLAAGATLCSLTRQDYLAKMANTHSASVKQQYVTRANNLNTGMWTCVGCLAALYVYNIVDAFVTPGARRVIVTPAVSPEGQYGASVSYNF